MNSPLGATTNGIDFTAEWLLIKNNNNNNNEVGRWQIEVESNDA